MLFVDITVNKGDSLYWHYTACYTHTPVEMCVDYTAYNCVVEFAALTRRISAVVQVELYAFFWVIPGRLKFVCRRFGTLCSKVELLSCTPRRHTVRDVASSFLTSWKWPVSFKFRPLYIKVKILMGRTSELAWTLWIKKKPSPHRESMCF